MAMIMAIGFLVILAGMMAVMLNMAANSTARTEYKYFKEQAQLLAQSATEYAILAISAHNRNGNANCLTNITSTFPTVPYFDIRTTIRYIGLQPPLGVTCGGVNSFVTSPFAGTLGPSPVLPESEGMVLIDVYVTSRNNVLNLSAPVAFHRRTLQKP